MPAIPMDQQAARDILSGRRRGLGAALLRGLAWVLSKPYGWAVRLRRVMYRVGLGGSHRAPVPVISVGNLTTGGTGKTPMVAWIAERLRQAGFRPAILMRGYKSRDGISYEAEMLRRTTGAAVVVNPDRLAAARAAAQAGAEVLILDDGFQHLRLKRDLDIVLIDATNPFGYGHCLPRGLLREPPSALREADVVVITRADLVGSEALAELRERLVRLAPGADILQAGHVPTAVILPAGRHLPPSVLAGKPVAAFCGIGNPESFFATLSAAGAEVVKKMTFDDHAAYDAAALERIAREVAGCRAEALVTTAKDRVKIEDPTSLPLPLWTLQVGMGLVGGGEELARRIAELARR